MSKRGAISPERDEIVGERGAEMSGAGCCDIERWSGGSEHPRERGAGILTAQLRSHALISRLDLFSPLSLIADSIIRFVSININIVTPCVPTRRDTIKSIFCM